MTRRTLAVLAIAAALPAQAARSAEAVSLNGTWVAPAPAGHGKIVLVLRRAGAVYKGTYTEPSGKPAKVLARATNADGVQQITLTFTASNRSTLCGLRLGKIYCSEDAGTAIFTRR